MARTLDAAGQLLRAMRGHYVRLYAIATSALRRAENGDAFAQRVQDLLRVPLRTLSGEEEAAASYRGALTAFDGQPNQRTGVLDIGGGSTEYAVGDSATPQAVTSCEIGAVRLTEAIPQLSGTGDAGAVERARAMAREALAPIAECAAVERVALVGGSATTTAAIVRKRPTAQSTTMLTRDDLAAALERLVPMTLDERKAVPGMRAQRADILPAGIIVLDEALAAIGQDRAVATTADLLLGVLLQERDAERGRLPHERHADPRAYRRTGS